MPRIARAVAVGLPHHLTLRGVVRYIERNPVRAGLVKRAWDYDWSSARHNVLGEPDQLITDSEDIRNLLGNSYRSYIQRDSSEETSLIRRETGCGRPLGDAGFVARLESRLGRTLARRRAGRPRLDSTQQIWEVWVFR